MKVDLISYTPDALNLLLRTKNTRLRNDDDPRFWSNEMKAEHLAYMRNTIKSSWEFVDYTFEISGVSRSFTHQFVRTDAAHFAQESQRTVDVRDGNMFEPDSISDNDEACSTYESAAHEAIKAYAKMIDIGIPVQDAREILPTGMTTSIIAKFDLKTLHYTARQRLCVRTQGQYQNVFRRMREEILKVHPWAEDFLQVQCIADGTCAFPLYGKKECPIYDPRMDLTDLIQITKKKFWSSKIHVAIPVAKDGKTM